MYRSIRSPERVVATRAHRAVGAADKLASRSKAGKGRRLTSSVLRRIEWASSSDHRPHQGGQGSASRETGACVTGRALDGRRHRRMVAPQAGVHRAGGPTVTVHPEKAPERRPRLTRWSPTDRSGHDHPSDRDPDGRRRPREWFAGQHRTSALREVPCARDASGGALGRRSMCLR